MGIVGLGGSGKYHIFGFNRHPGACVVAGADTNPKLRRSRSEEYGLKCYENMEAMLNAHKLDIVSIVTPTYLHKDLTIQALKCGCHVMCEKPMAMNSAESLVMVQAAQKAGRQLGIHFNKRFSPQATAMKKIVDSGELGDIYFARSAWCRRRGIPHFGEWGSKKTLSGGGAFSDIGVHSLDLALWLMSFPEPSWVMASSYNHIGAQLAKNQGITFEVEDMGVSMIKFKNGTTLELEAAWAANIKEKEFISLRLLGDKAGLLQQSLNGGYECGVAIYLEKDGFQYDTTLQTLPSDDTSHYAFVDAVLNGVPFMAGGGEGHAVMKILDAVYKSAETGKPIHVL
ncbi:MAG: Gfo/Idh/MocA family oxidoreductase [Victivallales bacterium]